MSQQLRYIVDQLNGPPFSRHYNLVTFDSLESLSLLQVLNDVLAEISPEHRINLREEAPDQTALRMFSLLRILKYKPKTDEGGGLNAFRQGLLQGEKGTIYPLLRWLLERSDELKKRAYLAKFLVRIDVPAEFLQEEAAIEMHTTYQGLVEEFKELHRVVEQQRYPLSSCRISQHPTNIGSECIMAYKVPHPRAVDLRVKSSHNACLSSPANQFSCIALSRLSELNSNW